MKKVILGKTSLHVSRLAFGCWQLSPSFWGSPDIASWRTALDAAAAVGINFLDTADAYGEGLAETELGKYFHDTGTRDQWVLATKFYWDFTTPLPPALKSLGRVPNTHRDYILRACETSLRRLRTDRIDLYQLHAWTPLTRPEEVAEAISQLRREGKILHFGVSNLNVEQMEMLAHWIDVETLQPKYNPLYRHHESREFPYCIRHNIGTLVYSPLERGLFGGHIRRDTSFHDARKNDPLFSTDNLARLVPALETLTSYAAEFGLSLPQFIIRWVLTHPAVHTAIIGVKRPEHITSLVKAADEILPSPWWHAAAVALPKDLVTQ